MQTHWCGDAPQSVNPRKLRGNFPRRCVEIVHVVKRFKLATGHALERALYRFDNIKKPDPPLQEGMDGRLVRRVQDRRTTTAANQRLAGDAKRGEAVFVGLCDTVRAMRAAMDSGRSRAP